MTKPALVAITAVLCVGVVAIAAERKNALLAHAYAARGLSAMQSGNFAEAVDCYALAVANNPERADYHFSKAEALDKKGDTLAAARAYRILAYRFSDDTDAEVKKNVRLAATRAGSLDREYAVVTSGVQRSARKYLQLAKKFMNGVNDEYFEIAMEKARRLDPAEAGDFLRKNQPQPKKSDEPKFEARIHVLCTASCEIFVNGKLVLTSGFMRPDEVAVALGPGDVIVIRGGATREGGGRGPGMGLPGRGEKNAVAVAIRFGDKEKYVSSGTKDWYCFSDDEKQLPEDWMTSEDIKGFKRAGRVTPAMAGRHSPVSGEVAKRRAEFMWSDSDVCCLKRVLKKSDFK